MSDILVQLIYSNIVIFHCELWPHKKNNEIIQKHFIYLSFTALAYQALSTKHTSFIQFLTELLKFGLTKFIQR